MHIVSIKDKSSLLNSLTEFTKKNKIFAGQITGIGAVNDATLRFFNPETKKYIDKNFHEQMEITSLSGNISEMDKKPQLHLHVNLGKQDYSVLGGHLLDAHIRGAGEFFIYPLNVHVKKIKNENIGLNVYDFIH